MIPDGPWTACVSEGEVKNSHGDDFLITSHGFDGCPKKDRIATLALVTAAPELLAACKAVVENCEVDKWVREEVEAAIERAERTVL